MLGFIHVFGFNESSDAQKTHFCAWYQFCVHGVCSFQNSLIVHFSSETMHDTHASSHTVL